MKIIYHNDLDGKCSAAIMYWHFWNIHPENINHIDLIEMDYNREFPFDKVKQDEMTFVLD